MGDAVEAATQRILNENRSPSRKVGEADNRESHFYFAMYWADALSSQDVDADLKSIFSPIATKLREAETTIVNELRGTQGSSVDIGGYYHPDVDKVASVMRPSKTFNDIIASA
jgi:isocitrate dehydrogenase